MGSTKIRKLDISLKIDGQRRHPTSIVAVAQVNAYPSITVTHHYNMPADREAIDMTSADVCKEMGERQVKLFSEDQAKAQLRIRDGKGGTLNFNGVVQSPAYAFAPWAVDLTDVLLPDYAAMENINYGCYVTAKVVHDPNNKKKVGLKMYNKLPELFYQKGEEMQKAWNKSKPKDNITVQSQIQVKQDEINQKFKHFFEELVQASSSSFGWDNILDWVTIPGGEVKDDNIIARMEALLRNNSGSFLTTLCRFSEEYMCLYVPKWDKVGALVSRTKLLDEPQDYKAEVISMNLTAGGRGMLPIRYVAVTGTAKSADPTAKAAGTYYVCYPESLVASGSMIQKNAPQWMPPERMKAEIAKGTDGRSMALRMKDAKKQAELVTKSFDDQREGTASILKEWARCCYIWEALGNTRAEIVVPLDLKVQVGLRYKVSNNSGGELFEGFLTKVTHNIKSASGTAGSCTTTMSFSHITLPGFELPE